MTTTTSEISATELVANSRFLKAMVQQIRVNDPYGTFRTWSDELLLKPYILTREQKKKISIDGEVDPITKGRILAFYRAVAHCIEEETGKLCQVVIDLSHEGFGWSLVFCGRLLAVSRTLRDAQRFGFDSLEKLAIEGDNLTQSGIDYINRFPEVTQ